MKRPVILACAGAVLVAGAFAASRLRLRLQEPPDATWSVTQKRLAKIAWALVERQNDTWSQEYRDRWPQLLRPRELHYGRVDMVWKDEWNRPFVYRPHGDTSFGRHEGERLPAKMIGEQILNWNDPTGGDWIKGAEDWEPDGSGWMRRNPDGSSTHTGIWIDYVDLVSFGKDGKPGGTGEERDIIIRMHDSRDSCTEQKRTGGKWTSTRTISWRFLED